jgi:hypothetical protein
VRLEVTQPPPAIESPASHALREHGRRVVGSKIGTMAVLPVWGRKEIVVGHAVAQAVRPKRTVVPAVFDPWPTTELHAVLALLGDDERWRALGVVPREATVRDFLISDDGSPGSLVWGAAVSSRVALQGRVEAWPTPGAPQLVGVGVVALTRETTIAELDLALLERERGAAEAELRDVVGEGSRSGWFVAMG